VSSNFPTSIVPAGPKQVGTWGKKGKTQKRPPGPKSRGLRMQMNIDEPPLRGRTETADSMTPILHHPEWQTDANRTLSGKTR